MFTKVIGTGELLSYNKQVRRYRSMKKRMLIIALCASALMPVTVLGEEAAVQNESTVNNEGTASGEENSKIDESEVEAVNDTVTVAVDTDILDYPGKKEGNVIGEVLEGDEISRTGTIYDVWSRILFEDESGRMQTGYIPTSYLEGYEENAGQDSQAVTDGNVEAGIIHKSSGQGVFADAVDGVTQTGGDEGVMEGEAVMASADSSLRSLGNFIITHYCPCSICCGPWRDGITSTGATAVTNRTIAVDPTVIPYGSKVVINGQIYVAEDCGGAIKNNHIDIYVGSHAEAENKGVYETEVYLLEEGPHDETEAQPDAAEEENTEPLEEETPQE